MIAPIFSGGGVQLYQGEAAEVLTQFTERGHVIFDPPYSAHVHGKSRAGARKTPHHGNAAVGNLHSPCNFSRAADLGFVHLTASDRRMLAGHAARLASRWVLVFSDGESSYLWRASLRAGGVADVEREILRCEMEDEPLPRGLAMEAVRLGYWRKIGGTPQFTGDRPGLAAETITICHPKGRKTWNGGGKHGLWDEDFAPGETLWWDELTVLDRGGVATDTRLHPTQKPERLMIALVEDFTDPGDLVYDFTAGSCTTAIACLRAKGGPRRCVCVERDPAFAARAKVRLGAELAGSTYRARESGQGSLFG